MFRLHKNETMEYAHKMQFVTKLKTRRKQRKYNFVNKIEVCDGTKVKRKL